MKRKTLKKISALLLSAVMVMPSSLAYAGEFTSSEEIVASEEFISDGADVVSNSETKASTGEVQAAEQEIFSGESSDETVAQSESEAEAEELFGSENENESASESEAGAEELFGSESGDESAPESEAGAEALSGSKNEDESASESEAGAEELSGSENEDESVPEGEAETGEEELFIEAEEDEISEAEDEEIVDAQADLEAEQTEEDGDLEFISEESDSDTAWTDAANDSDGIYDVNNPASEVIVGIYTPGTYTVTANIFIPAVDCPVGSNFIQAYVTNADNPAGLVDDNDESEVSGGLPGVYVENNATLVVGEDDSLTLTVPIKNPLFIVQDIQSGDNVEVLSTTRNERDYSSSSGVVKYHGRITSVTLKLGDSLQTKDGSNGYIFGECKEYAVPLDKDLSTTLNLTVDFSSVPSTSTKVQEPVIQTYTYTGTEQGIALDEHLEVTSGDAKATNAGTYTFTVKPMDGYTWSDGESTDKKTYSWTINKAELTFSYEIILPSDVTEETIKLPTPEEIEENMTITGFVNGETLETANITMADISSYKWNETKLATLYSNLTPNYTGAFGGYLVNPDTEKTLAAEFYGSFAADNYTQTNNFWVIVCMTEEQEPQLYSTFIYDGIKKYPLCKSGEAWRSSDSNWNDHTDTGMVQSHLLANRSCKEAGTYTATVTPNGKKCWSDGTRTPRTITWVIVKAPILVSYAGESVVQGDEPALNAEVDESCFVNGETALTASGYEAPIVSLPDGMMAADLKAGTYELTPSGGSADNYQFVYTSGTLTVLDGVTAGVPKAKNNLYYTGKEQRGIASGKAYTLSGDVTAVDAGTYTVTATLKEGYTWEDGTTEAKELTWTIRKVNLQVSVTDNLGGLFYAYVDDAPEFRMTVTGFVNGETTETAEGYVSPKTLITASIYAKNSTDGTAKDIQFIAEDIAQTKWETQQADYGVQDSTGKARNLWDLSRKVYYQATGGEAQNYNFLYASKTRLNMNRNGWLGTPVVVDGLIYNGLEQTGVTERRGSTLVNNKATHAGSYLAIATADEGTTGFLNTSTYSFETVTTITWSIAKADATIKANDVTVAYGETPEITFTIEGLVGEDTAETLMDYTAPTVTLPENLEPGTYVLKPTGASANDYNFTYETGTLTVLEPEPTATPTPTATPAPTVQKIAAPTAAQGLAYNGAEQIGVPEGTGYILSGTYKATEPGTYTARAALKDGYAWEDGSTKSISITWTIDKAEQTITAKTAAKSYKVTAVKKKAKSFSIGAAAEGTVTYQVTKTPTAKAAKYISVSASGKVKLKKKAPAGQYVVTITAAETATSKAATKDVVITVKKLKQKIKVQTASKKYKASRLKKKKATFKIGAKAKGKLSYKVSSAPKNGSKYIKVSKKGVVTLKKGAPKGTYKIKVTAKATKKYAKATKTIKITVK